VWRDLHGATQQQVQPAAGGAGGLQRCCRRLERADVQREVPEQGRQWIVHPQIFWAVSERFAMKNADLLFIHSININRMFLTTKLIYL
jgi:hypothetical protein